MHFCFRISNGIFRLLIAFVKSLDPDQDRQNLLEEFGGSVVECLI